jgi:outer membrane protein assembly factor BamB
LKSEVRFVAAVQILAPAVAVVFLLTPLGFGDSGGGSKVSEELDPLTLDWASFRGTKGQGVLSDTGFPISWDEAKGKGILWKSPVPLKGACSPVVCGNRVFLAGADAKKRAVYCFDANTGALLWQRNVATSTTQEDPFDETGYAMPTVAMDGRRVFAAFGTGTVACFTYNGDAVWSVDLGLPKNI